MMLRNPFVRVLAVLVFAGLAYVAYHALVRVPADAPPAPPEVHGSAYEELRLERAEPDQPGEGVAPAR